MTTKNPPNLWTVIHESSLKHVDGSRADMTGQLERALDTARLRSVTVQSLPHNVGATRPQACSPFSTFRSRRTLTWMSN
ncbi:Scr1 family TA system antitoxin-like transcriptional regulator [Streptomyces sp. NPDC006539]|uniref:Scr1 family TA system antitoxin-like transcriptional regulator n=1 Tax=Streptomyces sp. NPDC006539 TaxID=3155352 RepID=UPI00339E2F6A